MNVPSAFSKIRRRVHEAVVERRLGINTRGWMSPEALGMPSECHAYEPLEYEAIYAGLRSLDFTGVPQVLLDYGSGKGRVMAAASEFPFKKILGVEFSSELCAAARANLIGLKSVQNGDRFSVIQADAATFQVPPDVNVYFLFNPFLGSVLEAVAKRIEESQLQSPRPTQILYVHFLCDPNPFDASSVFAFEREIALQQRPGMRYAVYKSRE